MAKIDELKREYTAVDKQLKECQAAVQKLGIRDTGFNEPTHRTVEASAMSPKELQGNIHNLESRLEALTQEAERLEAKCRATEVALIDKTGQLKQEIDSNSQREENFIAIRSTDPFEIQREIQAAKTREIELSNRIRSLQNLPLYKNEGGADALIRLKKTEDEVINLRAENDNESNKINTYNNAIERLKKEVEDLHRSKQAAKKDATRTKTMVEAGIARQRDGLFRIAAPTQIKAADSTNNGTAVAEEEYNDKLIRTLGLVRWRGEEPAWYKLQFLQKARKLNPAEPDTVIEELNKQQAYKAELSSKLDRVQALLKTAVEEEKQREDEHLVQKKKKEHQLLELMERKKELEYNLARITVPNGKKFQTANPKTGEVMYYNDAVSVFSDDKSDFARIAPDENLLDFYLDQIELDPKSTTASLEAVQMPGVDGSKVVSMLGINFYNHPTLTSQRVFGSHAQVGMLATFAFRCDHFFVQYCKANSVDVEFFYVGEHGMQLRFAVAKIELQDWLDANTTDGRANVVGVVNKFTRVQSLSGQNIGVLTYRLRSRMPVFSTLEVLLHNQQKHEGPVAAGVDARFMDQKRNLSIKITNGYGFTDTASTFLTFRVFGFPEVVTKRVNGRNPRWDHQENFTVLYNKGVREYLKTQRLEIMAFDDNVPFKQQGPLIDGQGVHLKDYLGSGLIGLAALTFDKPIVEKVYLKNSAGRVTGSLFVRIYFDDMQLAPGDIAEFNREWEEQLSRRIIGEMRSRKLTLRSTFMIADSDGNSEVNRAEFNRVVTEILQIKWSPEEADEYWRRLTRKSGKVTCSFGDLLTFYGHLLDRDLLGQQSVSESIKNINNYLNNSEVSVLAHEANRDPKHILSLMQRFSEELRKVQKAKNWNDKQLFDAYDTDKNHRLARHEFMIVSEDDLKLNMTSRELEAIFNFLDKDGTGNLDLAELFKAIHFDTAQFLKQELKESKSKTTEDWSKEKILYEFIQQVKATMKERNISVFQFFNLIDKSRNSKISRLEIKKFFEKDLGLTIPEKHLVIILSEIDKSNDNQVSVKEFCDFLELEQSLKLLNESTSRKELGELRVMRDLYNRACEKELTAEDLVMSMDKDHSGTIDTIELGFYLKEIASGASVADIEKFLAFVDRDQSKTISLKELRDHLYAFTTLAEEETRLPPGKLEELLQKLIPIIDANKESLKEQFSKIEVEPGVIKVEPFKQALVAKQIFSKEDAELVVNPICKPFTKQFGRIRYQELFNLKKTYENHFKLKESGLGTFRGAKLVTYIFRAMKKVQLKHKMSTLELFQCLDTNDDGHITVKELRKDLLEMQIELTEDQFEDLSNQLDKNKDGKVSFMEFEAYLRVIDVEPAK